MSLRLKRFWVLVPMLTLGVVCGYIIVCLISVQHGSSSPTFGSNSPLYALGSIDPMYFLLFQLATLLMVFDIRDRNQRSRWDEVLESLPITNFDFTVSRVLAVTLVMWMVVLFLVVSLHVFGIICATLGWEYGIPFQLHSVFNLLIIDAPVHLLFWSSFFVFVTTFISSRLLSLVVCTIIMTFWFSWTSDVSNSVLPLVSPSSNDLLFISDVVPQFPTFFTVLFRCATLLSSCALMVLAAITLQRNDIPHIRRYLRVGTIALFMGITIYGVGAAGSFATSTQIAHWKETHENHTSEVHLDMQSLSGTLRIDPRRYLDFDFTVTYQATKSFDGHELQFTLNPGFTIRALRWNNQKAEFSFADGLLTVSVSAFESNTTHTLQIVSRGIPDSKFGYWDSAVDIRSDSDHPRHLVSLFGTDSAIFHRNYVGLMPGTHWYPSPSPIHRVGPWSALTQDYFDVNVIVELADPNWLLVATTETQVTDDTATIYRLQSKSPIPNVGIFASRFQTVSTTVDGFTFNVYVHEHHSEILEIWPELEEAVNAHLRSVLMSDTNRILNYPRSQLSVVEIPRRLRTIGGGWRMPSLQALPGVVLVKEHGFPTVDLRLLFNRLEDRGVTWNPHRKIAQLTSFFEQGLGSDNPFMGAPSLSWLHTTSATGKYATVLDLVAMELLALLHARDDGSFSIYSTSRNANRVKPTLVSAFSAIANIYGFFSSPSHWVRQTRRLEHGFGSRNTVQESLEQIGFECVPSDFGIQHDLELVLLKSREIAAALFAVNNSDTIARWLAEMRDLFVGQNYAYHDFLETARSHGVLVDPFLTDWFYSSTLPGFRVSDVKSTQVVTDETERSQVQTSFHIKNSNPVSGVVRVSIPTEESLESRRQEYLNFGEPIWLEEDSTKQVTLLTDYELPHIVIDPGLSMNRDSFLLPTARVKNLSKQTSSIVQASTWSPLDIGIVVDDLDSGFSIPELRMHSRNPVRNAYFRMIRYFYDDVPLDFDRGLIHFAGFYDEHFDRVWTRVTDLGAYGEFRKTWARVLVTGRDKNPPVAEFSTQLPKTTLWKLEYHAPMRAHDIYYGPFPLRFTIRDESNLFTHDVHIGKWNQGWNTVGVFDLEQGDVKVLVSIFDGVDPPDDYFFADAIRWTNDLEGYLE